MKKLVAFLIFTTSIFGQSNTGELRLKITDPEGLGVKTSVELVSEANQFRETFVTDEAGHLVVAHLPFGMYRIELRHQGFIPFSDSVEVRSALPDEYTIKLRLASMNTAVEVKDTDTLVDPRRTGTIDRIGSESIKDRTTSLPGRSLQDLVSSQPGWLYEGNAVLHPRGSEYQTQFVVDGIPLTDNRSPSFGPEIEADDVQSLSIYTANIPAEYGRKMGGVVEVNTATDRRVGLHGQTILSGGSFDTMAAYSRVQYTRGKNTLGASAGGDRTDRYLNPPVIQNYTNAGTTGDFAVSYERDFTDSDRLGLSVRHELSRFRVPNEQLQQAAGQRQDRDNFETMGIISYQHIFSPNVVGDLRGMARDDSDDLRSNRFSTPIIAYQNRGFREGYFKGTISWHHGRQEWKAGVESDATFIHEQYSDLITDPARFDPGTPSTFRFSRMRPDLEQSAFVQDLVRLGKWTVSAGLRWDHYQLLVNQNAASPRLGVARYFPSLNLVLHASYDRVFQTPALENILLSSSSEVVVLNPNVLRLPVPPSHGNYYEIGFTKGFFGEFKLDVNYFRRYVSDYADDDQLLNTAVSFPISFRKADIYGAEGAIDIPHWGKLSGNISYSYIVGSAYFPVTGGLFLGVAATNALGQTSGRFWDSQDQRNTVGAHLRYQLLSRVEVGVGGNYGSGLPIAFDGTREQALAQYGQRVVDRVSFPGGRVKPWLSIDVSVGANLWKKDNRAARLQVDVQNLNNRLNLIDFAGLFSGNTISPPRSYAVRLRLDY
jgi:outer membrane cobalamin receptor